jgi:hypothetical protein
MADQHAAGIRAHGGDRQLLADDPAAPPDAIGQRGQETARIEVALPVQHQRGPHRTGQGGLRLLDRRAVEQLEIRLAAAGPDVPQLGDQRGALGGRPVAGQKRPGHVHRRRDPAAGERVIGSHGRAGQLRQRGHGPLPAALRAVPAEFPQERQQPGVGLRRH